MNVVDRSFPLPADQGPKKKHLSGGRRRKMFRAALRQELLTLANGFYEEAGVSVDDTMIDAIVNSAARQIEMTVRSNPDFGHKATTPGIKTEDELVSLLLKRLDESGPKGQVFGFVKAEKSSKARALSEAV